MDDNVKNTDHAHHKKKLVEIRALLNAFVNKFDKIYVADGIEGSFKDVLHEDIPNNRWVALAELAEGFEDIWEKGQSFGRSFFRPASCVPSGTLKDAVFRAVPEDFWKGVLADVFRDVLRDVLKDVLKDVLDSVFLFWISLFVIMVIAPLLFLIKEA